MKDYISIQTIICPVCRVKQTGILKERDATGKTIIEQPLQPLAGTSLFIKCCNKTCETIITEEMIPEIINQLKNNKWKN